MDFEKLTAEQRLVAEQAVLTFQALEEAVKIAPQGQGMVTVEAALHEKGFEHLRSMLELAVRAHDGAQKKGSALCDASVGKAPPTAAARRKRS
jgi:hypothetical protein